MLEIVNANPKSTRSFRVIGLKKVNWGIFTESNSNNFNFQNEIVQGNFHSVYVNFINSIYSSLKEAGGKLPNAESNIEKKTPGLLWWNDKCKE